MKKWFLLTLLAILGVVPLSAQIDALQDFCTLGGSKALVSGLGSSNYNQGIIPGCTVEVFLTGTTTHATIYSNVTGTPLTNPFTAVQLPSPNPGYWIFWAATGVGYDVKLSGGNGNPSCTTAPNCYATPLTYTDLKVGGGGGGTGVTSVSAGNANPLFNVSVSNPSTTPNIQFVQQTAQANTLFGNFTGATAAPFFAKVSCTGLFTCSYDNGANTWTLNVPTASSLSVTTTAPIMVNGGNGPVASGTANISCPTCGQANADMQVIPPIPGQYAVIYPQFGFLDSDPSGGSNVAATGGNAYLQYACGGLFCGTAPYLQAHWTFPTLASYGITPANVTAVYADAITSLDYFPNTNYGFADNTNLTCVGSSSELLNKSGDPPTFPYNGTEVTLLTSLTGSTWGTAQCDARIGPSGSGNHGAKVYIPAVRYIVYYTTDPPQPTDNSLHLAPPLNLDTSTNTLSVNTAALPALWLNNLSIAGLPQPASSYTGRNYIVWDAISPTDCTVGGGSDIYTHVCKSNGVTWEVWPGGGSGGSVSLTSPGSTLTLSPNPITGTGTMDIALNHANTWIAKQTQPAPLFSDLAGGGTQCVDVDNTGQIGVTGSACGSGGGGGVSGSGTTGFYALWTASTALGNGSLDDGITNAGFDTFSKPVKVVCATCATQVDLTYNGGHAPAGSAGTASIAPDTSGNLDVNENNTGYARVCTATNGICGGGGGGGYTNITGSASETTVALINTACGSGTYYATTPLSIATGGTVSCPVQFSKAGLWTIASGQTVTFAKTITQTDAPSQIFAGSGTVVFSAAQADAFAQWFGYVADGNLGANTGTDNYPATQAAITALQNGSAAATLHFPAGFARFTSGTPTISASNIYLKGAAIGGNNTNQTTWFASTSTLDNLHIWGVSGTNIKWDGADSITFARAVLPSTSTPPVGISIQYAGGYVIRNYRVEDAGKGIYLKGAPGYYSGYIDHGTVEWGYNGLTETTGTYSCYYLDGAALSADINASLNLKTRGCNTNALSAVISGAMTVYGDYGNAIVLSDIFSDGYETAYVTESIHLVGSGGSSFYNSDIHYAHNHFDTNQGSCVYATTIDASGSSATFDEGWCNAAGSYGLEFHNSNGIHVDNWQLGHVGTTASIWFDTVASSFASNNQCNPSGGTGGCILANATTSSSFIGNVDWGSDASATLIKLTGSSRNSIVGNSLKGTASVGISFDASSNNNLASNLNTIDPTSITTPVSDAGSGNAFAATVPLNNVTAGSSPSGTFDFSGATQLKLPVAGSYAPAADGEIGYDSTNKNWHLWQNGADHLLVPLDAAFTSGHCGQPTNTGGAWTIVDAGGACGISGGGVTSIFGASGAITTLVIPSGDSLGVSGTGTNNATSIGGITITGTPSAGYVPTATSSSTATWQSSALVAIPTFTGKNAYVSENSSTVASVTSNSVTTVAGEVWFLACRGGTSSITSVTFSDSQSNSWTKIGAGQFSNNPWIQIAFSKITNAGSTTFTCTPNASSQFQAVVAAGFNWTTTTPSVLGSASGLGTGTAYSPLYNTSAKSVAYTCGTFGATTGSLIVGPGQGVPSSLVGTSVANLNGTDDLGCEFSVVPYAVTGANGVISYQTNVGGAVSTAGIAY